ncbi:MAG: hypothetical protein PHR00_01510 [Patescibacteria group bacterium]|nr:hypothetical protein [Patescibacteria group bacterium]
MYPLIIALAILVIILAVLYFRKEFVLLKEFKLTVPDDYQYETQLTNFADNHRKDLAYYNYFITDSNFSKVSNNLIPGKTYLVKLWIRKKRFFSKMISFEKCLAWLKKNNVILTGAQGLSLVYQEKKEELPIDKWTVSFDEKENLLYAGGNHGVPSIERRSLGGYEFGLGYFGLDWSGPDCLMGFCDC